jgi:hypothetical protein
MAALSRTTPSKLQVTSPIRGTSPIRTTPSRQGPIPLSLTHYSKTPFVEKWYSVIDPPNTHYFSPENSGVSYFESEEDSVFTSTQSPNESVVKSVSKTVLVEDDKLTHHYTIETTMSTEKIDETPVEAPTKPKKGIVLVKTHGQYTLDIEEGAYDVPPGITVNYLSGAPPGECNMVADEEGQHWIDFFETMITPDMSHQKILDIAQQEGRRMKKKYLKQAVRLKRQREFAPGYTRRAGWIIYYGLKKIPELILTADKLWLQQLYMLQSDDTGIYSKGNTPWKLTPEHDMSLNLAVDDLIAANFTHITLIVLACQVWDERVNDRKVRELSKRVMKIMTTYSDKVVQPTSRDFLITRGKLVEGDTKTKEDAAIAKQKEEELVKVLQKLEKEKRKEDRKAREENKLLKSVSSSKEKLLDYDRYRESLKKSLKGPTGFANTQKALAAATVEKGGTRKKKRKTKKYNRYRQSKKIKFRSY